MQTTRSNAWATPAGTLVAGAIGAAGIWLLGAPEMTPFAFVLAAGAREAAPARSCLRRGAR